MPEPLLLVPGMMCDARMFHHQTAAISQNRAVQVASLAEGETIGEMAEAVLSGAPASFALAGASLGGIVAMEIIRLAPDRVTRLALITTGAQPEMPNVAAAREPRIVKARTGQLQEALRDEMRAEYLAPGVGRAAVLNSYLEMASEFGAEVYVRQSRALQKRPDQQKTLRMIRVPTILVAGEHDTLTPVRRHEFMATLVPGARLETVAEAGHLPTLEQPLRMTDILREWLGMPLKLR